MNDADWEALKREIRLRGVRIVAPDLPTSWHGIATTDETTARILAAVNSMLLDMLAALDQVKLSQPLQTRRNFL